MKPILIMELESNTEKKLKKNIFIYRLTARHFGKNGKAGIHLLEPGAIEFDQAIDRSMANGFLDIYIYGWNEAIKHLKSRSS